MDHNKLLVLLHKSWRLIKGFSLVELMVVVAITAAISAVAIPNYKSYVNKSKVTQMITTIDPCQTQVYQYFLQKGGLPDGSTAGQTITCQGQTVSSTPVSVANKISATYSKTTTYAQFKVTHSDLHDTGSATLYNLYIRLTISTNGDITFSCGWPSSEANGVPVSIMPSSCTNNMT